YTDAHLTARVDSHPARGDHVRAVGRQREEEALTSGGPITDRKREDRASRAGRAHNASSHRSSEVHDAVAVDQKRGRGRTRAETRVGPAILKSGLAGLANGAPWLGAGQLGRANGTVGDLRRPDGPVRDLG